MKNFFEKYKKIIFDFIGLLLLLLALSFILILVLAMFKVIYFDDGIKFNASLFSKFKNEWYGWCIIIGLTTLVSVILCFVPAISMALGTLILTLYDNPWIVFLIWAISVFLSSFIMYIVGRFGGYKICEKVLGKEDCEKSVSLIKDKGQIYFPLAMMFPVFPDDALVMIAGVLKMKLSWFIPSVVIGRGIGIATIVFGISIVPFEEFSSIYDWIVFITVCIFWIILLFKVAGKFNKYIEKKNSKKIKVNNNDFVEK